MKGTINELKQGLLKCANENKNRTYRIGQVIISSVCKDAKNTIEELEKENVQLKEKIKNVIDKLFNLLSVCGIGNYDTNIHHNIEKRVDLYNREEYCLRGKIWEVEE